MNSELSLTNPASIRAYFEKIRQLANSGDQYPVDLDEVWPLIYAHKGKAVLALKRDAIQHTDYQVFKGIGKNPSGGRPEDIYKLSVPCLEFFIACKVREVFEVYRQVFHAVVNQAQSTPLPLTPTELLVQQMQNLLGLGQQALETERRVANLEQRFERIEQIQQQGQDELLQLPAPTEPLPELSLEDKIRRYVNAYSRAKGIGQQEVWRTLYGELYYRYSISVNSYRLNPGESKLARLKQLGHLGKLDVLASNILRIA